MVGGVSAVALAATCSLRVGAGEGTTGGWRGVNDRVGGRLLGGRRRDRQRRGRRRAAVRREWRWRAWRRAVIGRSGRDLRCRHRCRRSVARGPRDRSRRHRASWSARRACAATSGAAGAMAWLRSLSWEANCAIAGSGCGRGGGGNGRIGRARWRDGAGSAGGSVMPRSREELRHLIGRLIARRGLSDAGARDVGLRLVRAGRCDRLERLQRIHRHRRGGRRCRAASTGWLVSACERLGGVAELLQRVRTGLLALVELCLQRLELVGQLGEEDVGLRRGLGRRVGLRAEADNDELRDCRSAGRPVVVAVPSVGLTAPPASS